VLESAVAAPPLVLLSMNTRVFVGGRKDGERGRRELGNAYGNEGKWTSNYADEFQKHRQNIFVAHWKTPEHHKMNRQLQIGRPLLMRE
jgi:hypothetical protein